MTNNKALFFINSLKGGGAEKVVLNLASQLNTINIDSVIVTLYKNHDINIPSYIENFCLDLTQPTNMVFKTIQMKALPNILKNNKVWNQFNKQYEHTKFELITAHLPMSHNIAMCSNFKNECIYVMHLSQEFMTKLMHPFNKKFLQKQYKDLKIACVSNGITKELKNKYKIKANSIKTVYNPVCINKTQTQQKLHNRPYIVLVGRLCKQKNQCRAIEIYNNLSLKDELDLIIIGDGPDKNKIEGLINKFNLNNYIHLKPYQKNIHDWISQAKFLISTSLYEGFSLVLAEALALNTPAISTECKYGPSEILTDNLQDYLIPKNASDSVWNDAIVKIKSGKYPKIEVKHTKNFEPNKIVKDYINYYEE